MGGGGGGGVVMHTYVYLIFKENFFLLVEQSSFNPDLQLSVKIDDLRIVLYLKLGSSFCVSLQDKSTICVY